MSASVEGGLRCFGDFNQFSKATSVCSTLVFLQKDWLRELRDNLTFGEKLRHSQPGIS
jgi:hypothetical protein